MSNKNLAITLGVLGIGSLWYGLSLPEESSNSSGLHHVPPGGKYGNWTNTSGENTWVNDIGDVIILGGDIYENIKDLMPKPDEPEPDSYLSPGGAPDYDPLIHGINGTDEAYVIKNANTNQYYAFRDNKPKNHSYWSDNINNAWVYTSKKVAEKRIEFEEMPEGSEVVKV